MANRQELTYDAAGLVSALPASPERDALAASLVAAGDAIYANERLSMTERVEAANIDIALAEAEGAIPPAVLAKVRERAAWADANAKDKITRQSVIDDAAYRCSTRATARARRSCSPPSSSARTSPTTT